MKNFQANSIDEVTAFQISCEILVMRDCEMVLKFERFFSVHLSVDHRSKNFLKELLIVQ